MVAGARLDANPAILGGPALGPSERAVLAPGKRRHEGVATIQLDEPAANGAGLVGDQRAMPSGGDRRIRIAECLSQRREPARIEARCLGPFEPAREPVQVGAIHEPE